MDDFPRQQQTIARPAEVRGFGYWSGRDVCVEFRPAEPDTGIVFVRRDVAGHPRIPALVANRFEVPRRTSLRHQAAGVDMVEHILAALAGLQIDNCEVWVDQPEMPGCDGSSLPLVEALDSAGIVTQAADRPCLIVRETIRLGDETSWVEASPNRTGLAVRYRLDFGRDNPIGRQTFSLPALSPEIFRRELAPSRTFLLQQDADWLRQQGLGLRTTPRDLLVFGPEGPIDNTLRFPDECARHKTLDLIGDLALAGCDVVGQVVAYRSGHRLNAALVRALLSEGELVSTWRRSA